jgi:hypothetical protein
MTDAGGRVKQAHYERRPVASGAAARRDAGWRAMLYCTAAPAFLEP